MGPGRAQDRTQARVWMAPPRDSNRLLGLSDSSFSPLAIFRAFSGIPPFFSKAAEGSAERKLIALFRGLADFCQKSKESRVRVPI